MLSSCSTIKILDAWTADNVESIKSQNILVVARTSHEPSRMAFESELSKELVKNGMNATESYKQFPKIDPDRQLTSEEIEAIKNRFREVGMNTVVVSVVKNVEEISQSTIEGGYTAGASLASYYDRNYIGFYGYYGHAGSHSTYKGVDVAETVTTKTNKTYVLETTVHNLDLPEKEQLVALVTSKIVEPDNITGLAGKYAKAIIKEVKK